MIVWWILLGLFIVIGIIAIIKKPKSIYKKEPKEWNPVQHRKVVFVPNDNEPENADGVRGHLEATGDSTCHKGIYEHVIKRVLDIVLSFCGLLVLSPILAGLSLWIVIDDPGPVLFTQKRIGCDKRFFKLHKFRSMKMSTPHDKPTHMLENPEQYITKAGYFMRSHSLDELPQIWDIFIGNMTIIGPRPGLWNQDLLTAERDKWNANDIKPGLTGWAQINGRDAVEIPDKARLDGIYAEKLLSGGFKAFMFDCKCFFGTITSVLRRDGVVEGGTGNMKAEAANQNEERTTR